MSAAEIRRQEELLIEIDRATPTIEAVYQQARDEFIACGRALKQHRDRVLSHVTGVQALGGAVIGELPADPSGIEVTDYDEE